MPAASETDALLAQLQRRLVESGEWDRLRAVLASKLTESGWTDNQKHWSKEHARKMEPLSFRVLLSELTPHAQAVPLAIKREILDMIRQYIDKQFE